MDPAKKQKLEKTISALQARWGAQAVQRLKQMQSKSFPPHLSTGFSALDEALLIGGLPYGRISEIVGAPTSGMATVALRILATAQNEDKVAVFIDPDHTFDPDYAARCGLILSQLILVRPFDFHQALVILHDFILGAGINVLVFDVPFGLAAETPTAQALAKTLDRLIAPLGKTECVLLFLAALPIHPASTLAHYPAHSALPHYASIRLHIQRERWIYQEQDIHGYQAQILVIKNKFGPAGRLARISLTFAGEP